MHEKGVLQPTPTQNIQMMRSEPCKEGPSVNMVLRSGATTREYARKQCRRDSEVCGAPTKEPNFEMEHEKGTSKEAKKGFTKASTSSSKDQLETRMDPSM